MPHGGVPGSACTNIAVNFAVAPIFEKKPMYKLSNETQTAMSLAGDIHTEIRLPETANTGTGNLMQHASCLSVWNNGCEWRRIACRDWCFCSWSEVDSSCCIGHLSSTHNLTLQTNEDHGVRSDRCAVGLPPATPEATRCAK